MLLVVAPVEGNAGLLRCATLCTWWTGLYYYRLEIDIIHVVMRRIYEVSVNLLLWSLHAVAKSSSSNVITAFQQHMYELCSSVHILTKHFLGN